MAKNAIIEKTTDTTKAGKRKSALTLLERTVCLTLNCDQLGNHRKVELSKLQLRDEKSKRELDTDKDELKLTKLLLNNDVLQPVRYEIFSAKMYLRSIAISSHRVFGNGTYLVPLSMVEKVDKQLQAYKDSIEEKIEVLVKQYHDAVEDRRKVLGDLFDEHDYLRTDNDIRAQYSFDWNYVSFATPDRLEKVSTAMAESAKAKYMDRMADAYEEYKVGLRKMAQDVVDELLQRLSNDEDGKPRTLRNKAMDSMIDLFEKLPLLNVTDDKELSQTLAALKKVANGYTVDDLRKDEVARKKMSTAVGQAKKQIEALVEVTSGRAIRFK